MPPSKTEDPLFAKLASLTDAGSAFELMRTDFSALVTACRQAISEALSKVARESDSNDPPRISQGGLLIFENNLVHASIGLLENAESGNGMLFSLPCDLALLNISGDSLNVVEYKIPDDCVNEIFEPGKKLIPGSQYTVPPGQAAYFDAKQTTATIEAKRDTLVLKVFSQKKRLLSWAYSKSTLTSQFASSVGLEPDRLIATFRLMLNLSKESGVDPRCIDALRHFSRHPIFFVRWKAIQCLFEMSPECGLPPLDAARNDPHPHVRAAAQRSWRRLYGDW